MKYASYCSAKEKTATFSQSDSDGHAQAFAKVMEMLSRQVLQERGIAKLSNLRLAYVSELQTQGVPNSNYRGEKLKAKIENSKYQSLVGFSQITVSGCIFHCLLYDNRLSISDAIAASYRLGCAYGSNPHRVAASIHDVIVEQYSQTDSLSWPPTIQDLESESFCDSIPDELLQLFNILINGVENCNDKTRSISVGSICQVSFGYVAKIK